MVDLSPRSTKSRKTLTTTTTRALPDGSFMCIDCYEQKTQTFTPRGETKPSSPDVKTMDEKPQRKTDPVASQDSFLKPKEYICTECKYQFKRNPDFIVKVCPYCGKQTIQEKRDIPADKLVSNS